MALSATHGPCQATLRPAGRPDVAHSSRWRSVVARKPTVGESPAARVVSTAGPPPCYPPAMTNLQAALLHALGGVVAIAAAVVLAVTGHITGTDALAIILAAGGISGTGLAGSTVAAKPATSLPAPTKVATVVAPAPAAVAAPITP